MWLRLLKKFGKIALNLCQHKGKGIMAFIEGKDIYFRKLNSEDANEVYLSWLNDPQVLRYRAPKAYPSNMLDLKKFIEFAQSSQDLYFAICLRAGSKHIGGISLSPLNLIHRVACLNIMIGDREQWGKGIGREAVFLLTKHAFKNMNLHRLWVESPNPSFNRIVKSLGWRHEGTKREAFLVDGDYIDIECYGILNIEFQEIKI